MFVFCTGELVYLEDINHDQLSRSINLGLPETMKFNLRHADGQVELNLQENNFFKKSAPMYVADNGDSYKPVLAKVSATRVCNIVNLFFR